MVALDVGVGGQEPGGAAVARRVEVSVVLHGDHVGGVAGHGDVAPGLCAGAEVRVGQLGPRRALVLGEQQFPAAVGAEDGVSVAADSDAHPVSVVEGVVRGEHVVKRGAKVGGQVHRFRGEHLVAAVIRHGGARGGEGLH